MVVVAVDRDRCRLVVDCIQVAVGMDHCRQVADCIKVAVDRSRYKQVVDCMQAVDSKQAVIDNTQVVENFGCSWYLWLDYK